MQSHRSSLSRVTPPSGSTPPWRGRTSSLFITLEDLRTAWLRDRPPLLVPVYRGKHGHPIVIASRSIPDVLKLPPDRSLRDFVEQHRAQIKVVDVEDDGVVTDLDTPADYQCIRERWEVLQQRDTGF